MHQEQAKKKEGFKNQIVIVIPHDIKSIMRSDPLTSLLHVTDIGYYPNALHHYREREKGSRQHILIYCQEGKGWYKIRNQRFEVTASQFFVIESGTPHSYGAHDKNPWSIYWIHFTGEKSRAFEKLFNKTTTIPRDLQEERHEDRILLFEEIFRNLEMGYSIENLHYTTLCLWHLLGSFQYIAQFRAIRKAKSNDVVQHAINFMKANLENRLSLEEIAQSAGYSPSHFGALFIAKTKFTPMDYFNQLKIQKACQLLDFTPMKIKEVAVKLGFSDQYYFSKVFTKHMSISPSVYRSKQKG